jgi:hypothetical protein
MKIKMFKLHLCLLNDNSKYKKKKPATTKQIKKILCMNMNIIFIENEIHSQSNTILYGTRRLFSCLLKQQKT